MKKKFLFFLLITPITFLFTSCLSNGNGCFSPKGDYDKGRTAVAIANSVKDSEGFKVLAKAIDSCGYEAIVKSYQPIKQGDSLFIEDGEVKAIFSASKK